MTRSDLTVRRAKAAEKNLQPPCLGLVVALPLILKIASALKISAAGLIAATERNLHAKHDD